MKCIQKIWSATSGWKDLDKDTPTNPDIFLVFGGIDELAKEGHYSFLRGVFPNADIIFCSTAGEIVGAAVQDNSLVGAAIWLEKSKHRSVEIELGNYSDAFACGAELRRILDSEDLRHILVLSDGILVNGDRLVEGLKSGKKSVVVSGGLAADAGRFNHTLVGLNRDPQSGIIVAIGFYGEHFRVYCGSQGGWNEFGPERKVTESEGNILYKIDGQNALEIYKNYLGAKAADLPGSALFFPLSLRLDSSQEEYVVRTILSIDEEKGSMTFAGNVPVGATVRLMMANFDHLIEAAGDAAAEIQDKEFNPALVLMISCVGRKIVLGPRVEEETESVVDIFGDKPIYTGFYSNGEISPLLHSTVCSLHNQTMTITAYAED